MIGRRVNVINADMFEQLFYIIVDVKSLPLSVRMCFGVPYLANFDSNGTVKVCSEYNCNTPSGDSFRRIGLFSAQRRLE